MNKIIFLDRDGTIIFDPEDERVDKEEKIKLFPDTIEALKYLASNNFSVVLITNQAGIAEGRINLQDFDRINNKVLEMLEPSGIKILKTYVCPHSPQDNCECRKPKPTMILEAAKEFNVDLAETYMIGDRESDILAGINAGAKTVLVKTANKPVEVKEATYTALTLLDAVKYISANYVS
jgi:D-glycero-D-manno-heptose 1,7-bisphosphate phosphatase